MGFKTKLKEKTKEMKEKAREKKADVKQAVQRDVAKAQSRAETKARAEAFFKPSAYLPVPDQDLLSWMLDNPRYDVEKPIYVDAADTARQISYNHAVRTIRHLAAGFRAAGVRNGDCVLIHSFNDIYYPLIVLGILAAGGIFTGTNPAYTPAEISHHIRTAHVRYVVCEPELLKPLLTATDECKIPREKIWAFDKFDLDFGSDFGSESSGASSEGDDDEAEAGAGEGEGGAEAEGDAKDGEGERAGEKEEEEEGVIEEIFEGGVRSWGELLEYGEEDWTRERKGEDTAMRMFSSGTTGLPKAADMSHKNLIMQHMVTQEWKGKGYPDNQAVYCLPLPMFHAASAPAAHTSLLRSGYTGYILRRFDLPSYLSCITLYGVTELILVPPVVLAIVTFLESNPSARVPAELLPASPTPTTQPPPISLRSVMNANCGAAPLSHDMQVRLRRYLSPNSTMNQVWGMTETTCIATRFYHPENDDTGSVGRLVPNVEAKLVDDNGRDVSGYDVPGELCVRGPTIINGYFGNEKETRMCWDEDGFFHTGDIAVCRKEPDGGSGKWYIVDRKKELIKVRGFQVAPPEIEGVLLSHPAIVDAAVIGVAVGGRDGEVPRGYVVRKQGARLEEGEVRKFVEERVAKYKWLEGGVRFVEAVPRNASGKILKKELREMARVEKRRAGPRL